MNLTAQPSSIVRIREITSIAAPLTVASALLAYFGYNTTVARLDYSGVSLDLANISNPTQLLAGTETVFAPAPAFVVAVLLLVAAHAGLRWALTRYRKGRPYRGGKILGIR